MNHDKRRVKRSSLPPSIDKGKLRALRLGAGLSMRGLSERSGVPFGSISMIENGHRTHPTLAAIAALSRALDCGLQDLMPDQQADSAA